MNLWKVVLRHYFRHPWQILLSVIGIALGVAVVVAIDLANSSASKAFEISAEALTGTATHRIVGGPDGLPEEFYVNLRIVEGIDSVAPIIEGTGQLVSLLGNKYQTMNLLGIDVFAEAPFRDHLANTTQTFDLAQFLTTPNSAVLLQSTAKKFGLGIDSEFEMLIHGSKYTFTLTGLIKDSDELNDQALETVLFVDLATAQDVLGMQGRLSYIDLIIAENTQGQLLQQKILETLPNTASIIPSESRSYAMAQMTDAFQANLTALSLLALLVGIFLIYNTMTFAVIQRRDILGYLRTLGVTKRQIYQLIISEAAVIGIAATTLGVIAGIMLGNGLLHLVTRTINDLYFVISVSQLNISVWSILKGFILGVLATIVAVIIPAREATKSTPRSSYSRSVLEIKYKNAVSKVSWLGYILLAIGVSVLLFPTKNLIISFGGLFIVIMGFSLLVPIFTIGLVKLLAPLLRAAFGEMGNISARGVTASFSRTGVAVTSLTIAVAATIGVTVMIDSFKLSVVSWLENTLRADVYVSPAGSDSNTGLGGLSPLWVERFKNLPEVESISISRRVQLNTESGYIQLFSIQLPRKTFSTFKLREGDITSAIRKFFDEEGVLVSEPYSFRHGLHVGDTVTLPTVMGDKEFKIAGIYVDYGSDQGVVAINRRAYMKYWQDSSVSSLGVYAKHNADIEQLVAKMHKLVEEELDNPFKNIIEQDLSIRSNRAIREASIRIFDRTFAVTQVLRLLAIIVAFVGILSALMAIQIERGRELALMRAIGLTPRQVWIVVNGETGIIGVLSGLLAIPLGIALAVILILVINRRSFGWSMEISVDPFVLSQSLFLAIVAALLAGVYPAYRMARIKPANALRDE